MIAFLVCALSFAVEVPGAPLFDRVDRIELNHHYDGDGKHTYDQIIFWEWDESAGRYKTVDWDMPFPTQRIPERRHGRWTVTWRDCFGELRRVEAVGLWETWTQHDPLDLEDRVFPAHRRRGLSQPLPPPNRLLPVPE